MAFSRFFKAVCVFLAILASFSMAAKNNYAKVHYKTGDVSYLKNKADNWVPLKGDQKVYQGDLIQTYLESMTILRIPDGSTISIEENSIVSVAELVSEDGKNTSTTDIKKGKVRFDVQKQANKESSFKFKTGTAVAAIRGTEGVIGTSENNKFIASLLNGQLEIVMGGKSTTINGGQTAIPNGDELVVMDLSNSGTTDLFNIIDKILGDTTLTMDSLSKLIIEKNLDLEKAAELAKQALKCEFAPMPDQVTDTTVVIRGKCAGADTVEISGQKREAKGNDMEFAPVWDESALGAKKFSVTCQVGALHLPCGQLTTNYIGIPKEAQVATSQNEPLLTVSTASPVSVSNPAAATIEGSFNTQDTSATLFVKLGKYTSPNLVPLSANGQFSHTISISERLRNWSEKEFTVEYNSKTLGSKTVVLGLDVDKSSKATNNIAPTLAMKSKDSLKCYAKLYLDNLYNDEVIYSYSIDNETANVSIRYKNKTAIKQSLTSGIHKYTFNVTDLAGNSSQITKTLGCFPARKHTIEIEGGKTEKRIRAPKPPQGYPSNTIFEKLTFKITNIPDNDPSYIKLITISQKGKKTILRPTDFQSNIFDHQLELEHNAVTNVTINVIMKNGSVLSVTKTYKVQ